MSKPKSNPNENQLTIFEYVDRQALINQPLEFSARIRRVTHEGIEYFSLVDMMAEFSDTTQAARAYWKDTKKRLKKDGFQLGENILQLKLPASDGKSYLTDVATGAVCLRIVQSIPSPKAETVRMWLGGLGYEAVEESQNPLLGLDRATQRAVNRYVNQGMTVSEALQLIQDHRETTLIRNEMTDAVKAHVSGDVSYSALTDSEYMALFMRKAKEIKAATGQKNARHGMTPQALAFIRIVESTFTDMIKNYQSIPFDYACQLMRDIAAPLGVSVREIESIMGIDLATGKPLLTGGQ